MADDPEVIQLRQALRMLLSDPSEEVMISGAPCRRSRWFDSWRWREWERIAWPLRETEGEHAQG